VEKVAKIQKKQDFTKPQPHFFHVKKCYTKITQEEGSLQHCCFFFVLLVISFFICIFAAG